MKQDIKEHEDGRRHDEQTKAVGAPQIRYVSGQQIGRLERRVTGLRAEPTGIGLRSSW